MYVSRRAMVIIGVLMVAAVTVGIGYAAGDDQIYACVDTKKGKLRIVDAGTECKKKEESLDWSKEGPAGPKGDKGDTGDKGDQGIPGTNGQNGAPGKDGADGEDGDDGAQGPPGVLNFYSKQSAPYVLSPGDDLTVDADCDSGDKTTGGGYGVSGSISNSKVTSMIPLPSSYRVWFYNLGSTGNITVSTFVVCADLP